MQRSTRAMVGMVIALALLGALPATVFAAQPSCGDTLSANTTLTADLDCSGWGNTALSLGADGITLDLGGHTLTGQTGDDAQSAVYTEFDHDTVTNGTIANAGYGVYTSYASGTTISWLTINGETGSFTDDYGIEIDYGANNKISHVTTNGPYGGLYLYESASANVINDTFTADEYGVYAQDETRDTFSSNTTHAPYGFYDDGGGGNTYLSNTANGGSETGFYIYCNSRGPVTMIDNTANNNSGDGIYTYECYVTAPGLPELTWIKGNTASYNTSNGIEDDYSVGGTWKKNSASHNGNDGFYLDYPGDVHFTANSAKYNSGSGLELGDNYGVGYGSPKDISLNVLNHNAYGIVASEGVPNGVCHDNTIRHNTVRNVKGLVCS